MSVHAAAALQVCHAVVDVGQSTSVSFQRQIESGPIIHVGDDEPFIYFHMEQDAGCIRMFECSGHQFRDDAEQLDMLEFVRDIFRQFIFQFQFHVAMAKQLMELIPDGLFEILACCAMQHHFIHYGVLLFDALVAYMHQLVEVLTAGGLSGSQREYPVFHGGEQTADLIMDVPGDPAFFLFFRFDEFIAQHSILLPRDLKYAFRFRLFLFFIHGEQM